MKFSEKVRRYWQAQGTITHALGGPGRRAGFYIPYRYADGVHTPGPDDTVPWLFEHLDNRVKEFDRNLDAVRAVGERLDRFRQENPEDVHQPRFNQDWFSGLDAAVAYAFVRHFRPRRILEIGSGHSTRFMVQAIRDGGLETHFHSVDPEPRRAIDTLCDEMTRTTVEHLPLVEFARLEDGDFLFLDGSHIAMPGTDVDYLFSNVLPALNRGVIVHIHDIALPDGYPRRWPFNCYNEQGVLLAMLGGGARYDILMPNAFIRKYHRELLTDIVAPNPNGAHEGSFWMRVSE